MFHTRSGAARFVPSFAAAMGLQERTRLALQSARSIGRLFSDAHRFVPLGSWNAARLLERNADERPFGAALLFEDQRYGWRDVDERANQWAAFFAREGIARGDVVALMMDNRPDFLFAQMGLSKIHAVSALINTHLAGKPLVHAINVAKPRLALVGSEHLGQLGSVQGELAADVIVHRDGSDDVAGQRVVNDEVLACSTRRSDYGKANTPEPMCYIYTSGTTGLPKPAVITNQRYQMVITGFSRIAHEAEADDVVYVALPLYHGNGQWAGWGTCLHSGAALGLRRKFSASHFWDDVNRFGATRFVYIGEVCRYLLNQPSRAGERTHKLRIGVGNGLRPDIWEKFCDRFGVPLIREFYGATEGNAPLVNIDGRPGMVGTLRAGQAIIRCDLSSGEPIRDAKGHCTRVDEGETGLLIGRINAVAKFDGYVDAAATQKKILTDVLKRGDSWFNTGDLMTLHENGWVAFADRVGDTFRWKGENVSTNEVAEVLNGAPGVLESNVYGVSVPGQEGRVGMASLTTNDAFDASSFARYVTEKLPSYQRPAFVRLLGEMRTTGTFKQVKVDYRNEGYDPSRVPDPLFYLDGERYVPIDAALHARLASGEIGPR